MAAFNTGFFGFASVAANASGGEATLNEVIEYLDGLRGPLCIHDVIGSATTTPSVASGQEGRFWLWNVAGGYTGSDAELLALNQAVGGFARGSLLWYVHGGWRYYEPDDNLSNRGLFAVLLTGASRLDDGNAYGAATNTDNMLHEFSRASDDAPCVLMFAGVGRSPGRWGSDHGWIVVGGYKPDQPLGWFGDPAPLFFSPSASSSVNVSASNEMAVGWHRGRLVRKLHVVLQSAAPLNTDRFIELDPAGRAIGAIYDLVSVRCLLNDSDSSETAGRVDMPVNVPNVGYHVWLDVPNKRVVLRRVADTAAVGGNSWALNNTDDYDSVELLIEYTAAY